MAFYVLYYSLGTLRTQLPIYLSTWFIREFARRILGDNERWATLVDSVHWRGTAKAARRTHLHQKWERYWHAVSVTKGYSEAGKDITRMVIYVHTRQDLKRCVGFSLKRSIA